MLDGINTEKGRSYEVKVKDHDFGIGAGTADGDYILCGYKMAGYGQNGGRGVYRSSFHSIIS